MNTEILMQGVSVPTAKAMEELGYACSHLCKPGTLFALVGDLGAGKTHWTKGLLAGLGGGETVTSPTFSLVHEYRSGRLPVFHFDFYRTSLAEEWISIGWDDYLENGGVIVAEWADKFPELLPRETRWLHFSILSDGSRIVREGISPSIH